MTIVPLVPSHGQGPPDLSVVPVDISPLRCTPPGGGVPLSRRHLGVQRRLVHGQRLLLEMVEMRLLLLLLLHCLENERRGTPDIRMKGNAP